MIREATRDDLAALGRLGAVLMRAHYAFDPRRFLAPGDAPEDGYACFLDTQLREPDVVILVAEQAGRVVGYVYAGLEPLSWKELRGPAGFIHDVAVDDPARGTGVARELIAAAIEWLRQRGAPRVMLWTAAQNERARRLFDAAGFRNTMVEMTLELS
ncbi:MAG TPA: GNAT family N-acetyltransferase [Vicinamibacterales bacterium]|nr:GNAT family N-acetyltransferase [Vicinamibacterales bacterium]